MYKGSLTETVSVPMVVPLSFTSTVKLTFAAPGSAMPTL